MMAFRYDLDELTIELRTRALDIATAISQPPGGTRRVLIAQVFRRIECSTVLPEIQKHGMLQTLITLTEDGELDGL